MKVERHLLETNLNNALADIKADRRTSMVLKNSLAENGVSPADTQKIISGKTPLTELSLTVLGMLTVKLYEIDHKPEINPETYFTESELKTIRTTELFSDEGNSITLPYTFNNVNLVEQDSYSTVVTAQELKKLWDSKLLEYNFETQREAKISRGKDDKIVYEAKTIAKSVKEVSELAKAGRLISSTLTFNARLGTSEESEELIYNAKNRTLTVTKGTILDILDGYHRISGILQAMIENPDLDKTFRLDILNYGVKRAQEHFAQINTTNPISKSRLSEMSQSRLSDFVVKELESNCELLKGRISKQEKIRTSVGEIVSFDVLSNAIEEAYQLEDKKAAIDIVLYLEKFFTMLFMEYPDAFISDVENVRNVSLINANQMFTGYIILSKKLKDAGMALGKLKTVVDQIDFDRNNSIWTEYEILDENKHIQSNIQKKVKKIFECIEIKGEEVSFNVV